MPRNPNKNSQVQPIRAPSGQPYGERQETVQAQQAAPLANTQGRMDAATALSQASPAPMLGGGDMLLQPTGYPDEPVTAGMPMGPGPGMDSNLPVFTPQQQDVAGMARYLPMLETLADEPGSSIALRNWVRRMRGSLPPNLTQRTAVSGQEPQ